MRQRPTRGGEYPWWRIVVLFYSVTGMLVTCARARASLSLFFSFYSEIGAPRDMCIQTPDDAAAAATCADWSDGLCLPPRPPLMELDVTGSARLPLLLLLGKRERWIERWWVAAGLGDCGLGAAVSLYPTDAEISINQKRQREREISLMHTRANLRWRHLNGTRQTGKSWPAQSRVLSATLSICIRIGPKIRHTHFIHRMQFLPTVRSSGIKSCNLVVHSFSRFRRFISVSVGLGDVTHLEKDVSIFLPFRAGTRPRQLTNRLDYPYRHEVDEIIKLVRRDDEHSMRLNLIGWLSFHYHRPLFSYLHFSLLYICAR